MSAKNKELTMEEKNCTSLYGLTPKQIASELSLEKSFQGKQIWRWLAKGVTDFALMTDLPAVLRQKLADEGRKAISSEVIETSPDEVSGAVKLGIRLHDGQVVECVLLVSASGHRTACLSSQVGCAMGCRFCRTGTMKLVRNLDASEIIEQLIHLQDLEGPVSSIVFMGMGEPMANIGEVLRAIEYFHDPDGIALGHRRITISTCGVVPGIRTLARSHVPVKLAVSLVTADQAKRESLMPVSKTFQLGMLKDALMEYQRVYGRRITFECCLMAGVNTSENDARKLAIYCSGLDVIVNLIPFNESSELRFRTPSADELDAFTSDLDRLGVQYTRRFSRGRGVSGACGQLAIKYMIEDDEDDEN